MICSSLALDKSCFLAKKDSCVTACCLLLWRVKSFNVCIFHVGFYYVEYDSIFCWKKRYPSCVETGKLGSPNC